jgi:hypothetical protein
VAWTDDLGDEARRRRCEERGGAAAESAQHHEVPDLSGAGEDQGGGGDLRSAAQQVRADHHKVAREPVGPDAAREQEDEMREHVGGQHDAEVGRRVRELDDRERECDRCEGVAEQRDRPAHEEQAEVAFDERPEELAADLLAS